MSNNHNNMYMHMHMHTCTCRAHAPAHNTHSRRQRYSSLPARRADAQSAKTPPLLLRLLAKVLCAAPKAEARHPALGGEAAHPGRRARRLLVVISASSGSENWLRYACS